jgi:hypothetical protein
MADRFASRAAAIANAMSRRSLDQRLIGNIA